MSLANVLAVSQAPKTLILLGDLQQLDQPMQGSHPDGTGCSALDHLLSGKQTVAPDEGLFLDVTWRLHPEICAFTSELFYEGKLSSKAETKVQKINAARIDSGTGLRFVPVEHRGNQNCSTEEAEVIAKLVHDILAQGATWTDRNEQTHVWVSELRQAAISMPISNPMKNGGSSIRAAPLGRSRSSTLLVSGA